MHAISKLALLGCFAMSACASVATSDEMSAEVAERLAKFDRTGETQNCLRLTRISNITPLDERRFLVRTGVSKYYLNETNGRCNGADDAFTRLQYTTSLSQLCRNEIINVVDNSSGFTTGTCSLGDFERLEKKVEPAE